MASKGRGKSGPKSGVSRAGGSKGPKSRPRPAVRANVKRQQRQQRPMPKPPARRPVTPRRAAGVAAGAAVGAAAAGAAAAGVNLAERVQQIQSEFASLEGRAQLGDLYDAIGNIDKRLLDFPVKVEALRNRGYVHSGDLEDRLEALDDKWDEIRPRVEEALTDHVQRLDRELDQAERTVDRLQATSASIRLGESMVNSLSQRVTAATEAVSGLYAAVSGDLDKMDWELGRLDSMMDLIEASPNIRLAEAEGPLTAVKADWHRDGDKGPEGVLVLTDLRLLFEERDEVVTKKRFGIFKAESEMVQVVHIDAQVSEIQEVEAKEEGGFLGMGKDDIIELTFAATAPVSRARFHLKGQDSADWAVLIKKIQTGEIDNDRADEYEDDLEALEETAASFPTACPNCFAAVEPPARGVTSVTCEFCGTVITPEKS
ncbi:MAG: hypothetical protein H6662_13595 [Ardenticatenaceae bacterium]|nr:hypothetical protein [Anaerolineales bacterium]MCB8922615.1 hypothetical protein [Ardenticatenaceae bacterium]MCB8991283.1 hypothetical protein [Ardenticatenaceae bacterium]MCB9003676.1 hypothetical protein [Ardenticatenaceae bacterium]